MRASIAGLAAGAVLAVLPSLAGAQAVLEATALYRERIAPPRDGVLEAVLAPQGGGAALGRATLADAGAPPYAVSIPYDPARVTPGAAYALEVRLSGDGPAAFAGAQRVEGLAGGSPAPVEVLMRRVSMDHGADKPSFVGAHGLRLPASFRGTLPCADCAGIRHHLDLWPDQVFHLRRDWLGREAPLTEDALGRWHVDPARGALVLQHVAEGPLAWEIEGTDRLRLLGRDGRPIDSDLPYALESAGRLEPTDLRLPLFGMFRYMADAALFEECRTGRRYPVAMEGDYLALERAYLAERPEAGSAVLATFDGAVAERPAMEGPPRRTVIVERYVGLWPGEACPRGRARATLADTYWRIESLMGVPVDMPAGGREPHLLIGAGDPDRFAATVGCNRIGGRVARSDSGLCLEPVASTLMACPGPLEAHEGRLKEALAATAAAEIIGPTMVLRDGQGRAIARLVARYLP